MGSAKELENLQHEVASLARRQSELEEVELEIMERVEDARAALSTLASDRDDLQTQLDAVIGRRDDAFGDIDGELTGPVPNGTGWPRGSPRT